MFLNMSALSCDSVMRVLYVACHESCAKSCSDDTPMSCDACAPGWQLATDGTGCQGKTGHLV